MEPKEMDQKEYGQYLKSLRLKQGLTMRKLDELSGVSHSYISQLERGQRFASVEVIKKLYKPLNVSFVQLMSHAGYLVYEDEDEINWETQSQMAINSGIGTDTFNLFNVINSTLIYYKGVPLTDDDRASVINHLDFLFRDRLSERKE